MLSLKTPIFTQIAAILNFEVVAVIVEQKYNASRISLKTPISTAILKFEVVAKIVERKW